MSTFFDLPNAIIRVSCCIELSGTEFLQAPLDCLSAVAEICIICVSQSCSGQKEMDENVSSQQLLREQSPVECHAL